MTFPSLPQIGTVDLQAVFAKYNPNRETARGFTLDDLAPYTAEGAFGPGDAPDFRRFMVGRDDVHGVLMHLLTRVALSHKGTMFGFDDDEVNAVTMYLAMQPNVLLQQVLDDRQAGVVHEKQLLQLDQVTDAEIYANDFLVGHSQSGQILHTKGGIVDGLVGYDGSTNESGSGEGIGIGLRGAPNVAGFKAQENTLTVFTNSYEIGKFSARLDYEAGVVRAQLARKVAPPAHHPV